MSAALDLSALEEASAPLSAPSAWDSFARLPAKAQGEARRRLEALLAWRGGKSPAALGISGRVLRAWGRAVAGVAPEDWLPALARGHRGGAPRVEAEDAAFAFLKADYLRPEQPSFTSCYRRLRLVAAERGWHVPPERTLRRRVAELAPTTAILLRAGKEALRAAYPAQERDRSHFHALQAVNTDWHRWDVFVRWPDGAIARPQMIGFQDLYSGKILSWRVDREPNMEGVRLAFGDMVEAFGIPEQCYMDNGRDFAAKWITGGAPTRYRFKIRADEPFGIMPLLGVAVHWTTPYAGQSKPIERAFRDLAHDGAKDPRFAGAYTGNSPLAKPENYGSRAVPLAEFLRVAGEIIAEHNARPGRRSGVCAGRSFDEAFASSYEISPIRRAAAEQRRLFLMAAEQVRVSPKDGTITLLGNRFWAPFLTGERGKRVTVRFDPQALRAPLAVYRADGAFLGEAECQEAAGFDDIEAARAHAKARGAWLKAARAQAKAEVTLGIAEVAAMLPAPKAPPPVEARVVRPVFGNLARKIDVAPEDETREVALLRGISLYVAARREEEA